MIKSCIFRNFHITSDFPKADGWIVRRISLFQHLQNDIDIGANWLLFCILPAMGLPRSTVTKLLAACLLICSVWVFIACVLLCSAHPESANTSETFLSAERINTSSDDECCPIGQSPAGVLTERQSLLTHIDGGAQALFALAILTVGERHYESARQSIPPPTSDPPLERLCTLRI
ncbi:MAG: hypothetical protein WBV94_16620 [Blastocatellia bacterium]